MVLTITQRKEMFIKSQTVFVGRGITATPYNDRWRKHRRLATTWLNLRAVDHYTNVLDYEANVLLRELYRGRNAPINPQPTLADALLTTCGRSVSAHGRTR